MASTPINVDQSIIDVATHYLESNGCNVADTLNFLVTIRGDKEDIARAAIQYALDNTFSRKLTLDEAWDGTYEDITPTSTQSDVSPVESLQKPITTPQPDERGEFPTPADGASWMAATYRIPQIPLRGKAPWFLEWQNKGTLDLDQIDAWAKEYPGCNFGSVAKAEPGGRFVLEVDSPEVSKRAKQSGVVFSSQLIIESRPGRGHRWYEESGESTALGNVKQDESVQADFSVRVNNEQCVSPGSVNPVSGKQYRVVKAGQLSAATSAEIGWVISQKKQKTGKKEIPRNDKGLVPQGSIHPYMLETAGRLRHAGATPEEIEPILLRKVHEECQGPIDDSKVRQMACSMKNYEEGSVLDKLIILPTAIVVDEKKMPDSLGADAYYGVVGRHLRNIEANSEAHPAGILGLFLSGFGSIVGRGAYIQVEDTIHYPMVNVLVTGQSSRSRKDTAKDRALRPLKEADPIWAKYHIKQGFSSGEAVASYFDRLHRQFKPLRLFVTDTEFKTTLSICSREGNTLSEMYRHMFNGDAMEVNVKKLKDIISVPYSCGTSAGLITKIELIEVLKESELASGFVNRYLTFLIHRVKKISRPKKMTDPAIISEREAIVAHLKDILTWLDNQQTKTKTVDGTSGLKMFWSEEAGQVWDAFYDGLGDDDPEYLTRAEVFVMRLSMVYALLDKSAEIQLPHLRAALAVWKYAQQSANLVYGNPQPSNVVKLMTRALAAGYVKRGAVHSLFQRHMPADGLDWVMEEASKLSNGRLEVDYGMFKGERIVSAIHHAGKK